MKSKRGSQMAVPSAIVLLLVATLASQSAVCQESITIGDQQWMVKNLAVTKFRNGDAIPQATADSDWAAAEKAGTPAWCYGDNKDENGEKYGVLYNWFAVSDPRGLAPEGWHVPSQDEWKKLETYSRANMGEDAVKPGLDLRSDGGWPEGSNGTNKTGFAGLPGGFRNSKGSFMLPMGLGNTVGDVAWWWSSTGNKNYGKTASLTKYNTADVRNDMMLNIFDCKGQLAKGYGLSVRCLKD